MRPIIGSVSASIRKTFTDNFTRTDPQQVTKATDGTKWKNLRGSWGIVNNKLESSDTITESTIPIVAIDVPFKDANILQKNVGPGTATALWVTDQNNWWAVGIDSQVSDCNCVTNSCCTAYGCTGYGCTGYGCTATGCTSTGCTSTGCTATGCTSGYGLCTSGYGLCTGYGCTGYGCTRYGCTRYSAGKCAAYGCTGYGCTATGCTGFGCTSFGCTKFGCTAYGCTGYGCTGYGCTATGCTSTGCTSTGCTETGNCTTCQTCYPKYIKIFKSIASVVSTITSWTPGETGIGSFRVKTKGNVIKVQTYSDTDGLTAYGEEVTYDATPENPQKTRKFGIMITPAARDQVKYSGGIKIQIN